jgi:lysophospholipase L1-like esterase
MRFSTRIINRITGAYGRVLSAVAIFVAAFRARVLADGGTFEAENYLLTQDMTNTNDAILVYLSSSYKTNKLYCEVPTDGSQDFVFDRTTTATRFNYNNQFELMAANIGRVDYVGQEPTTLFEPAAINIFTPSDPSSGGQQTSFSANDWGLGFTNKCTLENNTSPGAYIFTTNIADLVPTQTYNISCFVKITDGETLLPTFGTGNTNQGYFSLGGTNITTGYTVKYIANGVFRVSASGVCGATVVSTGFLRWNTNRVGSNGTIEVTGLQITSGSVLVSYIPTTTVAVTKAGDFFTGNNTGVTGQGAVIFEFVNNVLSASTNTTSGVYLGTSSATALSGSSFGFRQGGGSQRANLYKYVGGSSTLIYTFLTDNATVAIVWNGTTADVFVDGVKVVSATAFVPSGNLAFLRQGNGVNPPGRPMSIRRILLFNTVKNDAYWIDATTKKYGLLPVKNYFDKYNYKLNFRYDPTNGFEAQNNGTTSSSVTDYIKIPTDASFVYLSGFSTYGGGSGRRVNFLTASKTYISHYDFSNGATYADVVIPENAVFVVVSLYEYKPNADIINTDLTQIEFYSETAYSSFQENLVKYSDYPIQNTKLWGKKFLAFGDSITETDFWTAPDLPQSIGDNRLNWTTFITGLQKLNRSSRNYASSGARYRNVGGINDVQKIDFQITTAIANNPTADVIFLNAGTNDGAITAGATLGTFASAMAKPTLASLDKTVYYEAIRWCFWTIQNTYPSAVVFVGNVLPRTDFTIGQYALNNQAIADMANQYGFTLVNQSTMPGFNPVTDTSDGLHPNKAGSLIQADFWNTTINNS